MNDCHEKASEPVTFAGVRSPALPQPGSRAPAPAAVGQSRSCRCWAWKGSQRRIGRGLAPGLRLVLAQACGSGPPLRPKCMPSSPTARLTGPGASCGRPGPVLLALGVAGKAVVVWPCSRSPARGLWPGRVACCARLSRSRPRPRARWSPRSGPALRPGPALAPRVQASSPVDRLTGPGAINGTARAAPAGAGRGEGSQRRISRDLAPRPWACGLGGSRVALGCRGPGRGLAPGIRLVRLSLWLWTDIALSFVIPEQPAPFLTTLGWPWPGRGAAGRARPTSGAREPGPLGPAPLPSDRGKDSPPGPLALAAVPVVLRGGVGIRRPRADAPLRLVRPGIFP